MIDNKFRTFFSQLVMPITDIFAKTSVSPNTLSFVAFGISASAGIAIFYGHYVTAIFLWWLGRFFDSMDGELARKTGKTTPFGAFLDITLDMLAYSLIILSFYFKESMFQTFWVQILFLYIGCITSALALGTLMDSVYLENKDNRGLRLATGLAEGGETGMAYTLFLLFPHRLDILLPVWICILSVTVVSRFIYAYQLSKVRS